MFDAIHRGNPDQALLAYQYLQMLPEIAKGDANKLWIIPSEVGEALKGLGQVVQNLPTAGPPAAGARTETDLLDAPPLQSPEEALAEARRTAEGASREASQDLFRKPGQA